MPQINTSLLALIVCASQAWGQRQDGPSPPTLADLWQLAAEYEDGRRKGVEEGYHHFRVPEFPEILGRSDDPVGLVIQALKDGGIGPPARPWLEENNKLYWFRAGVRTALGDQDLRRAVVTKLHAGGKADLLWALFRRRHLEQDDLVFTVALLVETSSHATAWALSDAIIQGLEQAKRVPAGSRERPADGAVRTWSEALITQLEDAPGLIGRFWLCWTLNEMADSGEWPGGLIMEPAYWRAKVEDKHKAESRLPAWYRDRMLIDDCVDGTVKMRVRGDLGGRGILRYEDVLRRLEEVLRDNPHHLGALGGRAVLLQIMGRTSEADQTMRLLKARAGDGLLYGWQCYQVARQISFPPQRRLHYCREFIRAGLCSQEATDLHFMALVAANRVSEARALWPQVSNSVRLGSWVVMGMLVVPLLALGLWLVCKRHPESPGHLKLRHATSLTVAYLLVQFPLSIALGLWAGLAAASLLAVGGYLMLSRRIAVDPDGIRWPGWRSGLLEPALGAVGCIVFAGATSFMLSRLGWMASRQFVQVLIEQTRGAERILAMVAIAICAPLGEEVLFRGLWFRVLRSRFGVVVAAIGSASVFAAVHLEPAFMPHLFAVGLVLAYVYHKTRSLLSVSICHGMNNAACVLAVWLML